MIDKKQARALVEIIINKPDLFNPDRPQLVIMDDQTIDKEWGWVFFYNSEEYVKSGDMLDALGGNAPYIVNKQTGKVTETGTAYDIEEYIAEYESNL